MYKLAAPGAKKLLHSVVKPSLATVVDSARLGSCAVYVMCLLRRSYMRILFEGAGFEPFGVLSHDLAHININIYRYRYLFMYF